jgi:hypothetical protein
VPSKPERETMFADKITHEERSVQSTKRFPELISEKIAKYKPICKSQLRFCRPKKDNCKNFKKTIYSRMKNMKFSWVLVDHA